MRGSGILAVANVSVRACIRANKDSDKTDEMERGVRREKPEGPRGTNSTAAEKDIQEAETGT